MKKIIFCLLPLFILISVGSVQTLTQTEANNLKEVFTTLIHHPESFNIDEVHEDVLPYLNALQNINMFEQRRKPVAGPKFEVDCDLCAIAANIILDSIIQGHTIEQVEEAIIGICTTFNIESEEVCRGMVHGYGYQVEYIVQSVGDQLDASMFCAVFVGEHCSDQGDFVNGWEVDIPETPPQPAPAAPEDPPVGTEMLRILQITDVHLDLSYTVGSPVNCGLPCCCMNTTGMAEPGQAAAELWGDYNCDLPLRTYSAMMDHVKKTHTDIDLIIFTGDSPAHDVWQQSTAKNFEHERTVMKTIVDKFPDIPVYLSLGNHEGFPVNEFATENEAGTVVAMDWLYGGAINLPWATNIDEEAKIAFEKNGYYSYLMRPGMRLISLNSNFCHSENFFLFLDFSDPGNQLAWLVDQLMTSEKNGEVVHILMHHPVGSCLRGWRREYQKIISRFQNTVTAQFHGHTHTDWFQVHHDSLGNPSAMSYIAPSVTTYQNKNPEYRLYTIANDPAHAASFGRVVDTSTWTTDLGRSHWPEDVPEWHLLYTAREVLGLESLSPAAWKDVLRKAMTDDTLFHKMVRFNQQDYSDPGLPDRRSFLCHMISNVECDL